MREKAPLPGRGGKEHVGISDIHSHRNKPSSRHSVWNVECEGCGWTAQFRTGREAGEGGWEHHLKFHHSKTFEKSPGHECPSTHIFRIETEKQRAAAKTEGVPYQMTSNALQGAEK